ncbi:MAG TPA: lyase family protein [Ktedonobacteraceae bacterium]|jgi:argininosuccinate lyase
MPEDGTGQETLTGRVQAVPGEILDEEVLQQQFAYELQHLLPYYLHIEQAFLLEYLRLDLLSGEAVQEIRQILEQVNAQTLQADRQANLSDILFAIERCVEGQLTVPAANWHIDRSRNDIQATAQLMFARERLLRIIERLLTFSAAVAVLAERQRDLPLPGYTHYQAAQILSAGFYLAALNEQLGKTQQRLLTLLDEINECPLGSGAMAGLELAWDRQRLAQLLGFARPVRHALVGVASKEWLLHIAGELSTCSVALSRFVTDLITWGSSEYQLIDLPDALSGISSAMPQKKNFPVLERIRGKTAHISAYYLDFVLAQRNTPYTNLVETAKEGGSNFFAMTQTMETLLTLFTTVIQQLAFRPERLAELCARDFFGGFALANLLTLRAHIPVRQAQVLAGRYIVAMLGQGRLPYDVDLPCLQALCHEQGSGLSIEEQTLRQVFSTQYNLQARHTTGSTNPHEVAALLALQAQEHRERAARCAQRGAQCRSSGTIW